MGIEEDASTPDPETLQRGNMSLDHNDEGLNWWNSIVTHLSTNLARKVPSRSRSKGPHPRWWLDVPTDNENKGSQLIGVYRDGSWTYGDRRTTLIRKKLVPAVAKVAPALEGLPSAEDDREELAEKIRKLFAYVMVSERPRSRSPEQQ